MNAFKNNNNLAGGGQASSGTQSKKSVSLIILNFSGLQRSNSIISYLTEEDN
jgi:hypothetical protein